MSNDPKPARRTPVKLDQLVVRISRFDSEKDRTPRPWEGPFARIIRDGHLIRADKKGTPAFSAAIYGEGAKRGEDLLRRRVALDDRVPRAVQGHRGVEDGAPLRAQDGHPSLALEAR